MHGLEVLVERPEATRYCSASRTWLQVRAVILLERRVVQNEVMELDLMKLLAWWGHLFVGPDVTPPGEKFPPCDVFGGAERKCSTMRLVF